LNLNKNGSSGLEYGFESHTYGLELGYFLYPEKIKIFLSIILSLITVNDEVLIKKKGKKPTSGHLIPFIPSDL